ncbi:MAG: TIGR04076 family protein [Anaerococcus sp.]|nr:TIGR04076 family protein [Anaerococcus sp.]
MKRGKRPKIRLTITDRKGECRCHRGHRVGDVFDYDTDRGDICPMALHCGFPYIDILRYGGSLPGQDQGQAEFCCSDADVIMVFKAEIVDN